MRLLGRVTLSVACAMMFSQAANAQVFSPRRAVTCVRAGDAVECPDATTPDSARVGFVEVGEKIDLLPQAGFQYPGDDPRLALQVVQYWLRLGDRVTVPLYLMTNLPTVTDLSPEEAAAALLDEYGGILNSGLTLLNNKKFRLGPIGDFADEDDGLFVNVRGGAKLAEYAEPGSVDLLPYLSGTVSGVFPITGDRAGTQRAGDLKVELTGLAEYMTDDAGLSEDFVTAFNVNVALAITEWGYFSFATTVTHSAEGLEDRWSVSFNLIHDED